MDSRKLCLSKIRKKRRKGYNQPQCVVLSEERYQALVAEAHEAYLARVRAALEDVKAGRVQKFTSAEDLLQALDSDEPA